MFEQFIEKYNLPLYRRTQLYTQYYKNLISSWDELTTWPVDVRKKLKDEIPFSQLSFIAEAQSDDGKTKKLFLKQS